MCVNYLMMDDVIVVCVIYALMISDSDVWVCVMCLFLIMD